MLRATFAASLLATSLLNAPVAAQPEVSEPLAGLVAGYHADLRELAQRIKAEHPRPFHVISEDDFDALVEAEIAGLDDSATRADFLWAMTHVIVSIGCGHSQLPFFNQQNAEIALERRFPVKARFHEGRLYVTDPKANAEQLAKGQEIVAINDRPVAELREIVFSRMAADVHLPNSKEQMANTTLTSYLTYALDFPESYSVTRRGEVEPVPLQPMTEFEFDPILSPNDPCREELCYERDEKRNVGIATLHSLDFYGGERADRFVAWWAEVMEDIQANDRDALLIDMRTILGGSGTAGSYMLRHLTDKPFAYFTENSDPRGREDLFLMQQPIGEGFDGDVFILMDGLTVSAAAHFFALAQANDIATLIGAPAGGGKSTNDGRLRFTSTNEGVEYFIARMIFEVEAEQLGDDEAVQPDITLNYSLADTIDRTDSMRETAIELLSSAVRHSDAAAAHAENGQRG